MLTKQLTGTGQYHWHCAQCQATVIVEVAAGSRVHTRVTGLDHEGKLLFGTHTHVEVGSPEGYECATCGTPVRDGPTLVTNRQQLASLLNR